MAKHKARSSTDTAVPAVQQYTLHISRVVCPLSPNPPLEKKGGPHTNQQTKPPRLVLLDILWLYAYASDVSVSYLASLFRLVSFLRFFRCEVLRHGLDLPL